MNSRTQPRVFVVQNVNYDFTRAEEYGELVFLLPAGDVSLSPAQMGRKLERELKDFSDIDFILPVGSPAAIMKAGIVAAKNNRGIVSVLHWDRVDQKYYKVVL